MLAFILLCCIHMLPGENQPTERSQCPVRFATLPENLDLAEYRRMRLSSTGDRTIKLLHPRELGLFVMQASGAQDGGIYGQYFVDEAPHARDFNLSENLWGMSWMPAAVPREGSNPEVQPGSYRVVLKYLGTPVENSDVSVICVAISPALKLTRSVFIASFEDGVKLENHP